MRKNMFQREENIIEDVNTCVQLYLYVWKKNLLYFRTAVFE